MSLLSWGLTMLCLPPRACAERIARGIEIVRPLVLEGYPRSSGGARWRRSSGPSAECPPLPPPSAARPKSAAGPAKAKGRKTPPDLHAAHRTFSALLVSYVNERYGGKAASVYRRAGIDRKLYSKIVSDNDYAVSRETALQLAVGLQLSRPELDEFLRSAGMVLTPTLALDRAFAHCLENGIMNILDVNRIIVGAGLPSLRLKF